MVFPTVVCSRCDNKRSSPNSSAMASAQWQAGWPLGGSASAATWLSWSGGLLRALSEVRWLSLPDAMRRSDVRSCEALMWPWCRFGLALLHSRFPLWTLLRTFAWKCSRQPTDQIHMDGFFSGRHLTHNYKLQHGLTLVCTCPCSQGCRPALITVLAVVRILIKARVLLSAVYLLCLSRPGMKMH